MKRRHFLRTAGLAAGVTGFPAILRSASPNSMLQVGAIGVGGMGGTTLTNVAGHPKVKITALCDVDAMAMKRPAASFPDAAVFSDWREMLASAADKFDAITVGIPDHMHAAPAVTAIRAGKHVYLQKPMATTLHECRVITEEAAKAGVVTQLGNQGRSTAESKTAVELIQSGAIGKIKEVLIWENKPLSWWPKNTALRDQGDVIPSTLEWDLWLGVREPRPWLEGTYHPKYWRAWFDFGCGEMGDMGCHHFDPTFDALNLTAPLRVRQTTPGSSGPLWGERRQVELIFPGTEFTAEDTVKVTWHDGDVRPDASRIQLPAEYPELPESGSFWTGESGSIFKNYRKGMPVVLPEKDFPQEKYPTGITARSHYHDWVDAVLEGRKSCADFSHGGPLTETVLVGALADRFANEWLEWDRKTQTFTNHAEATKLVSRAYRDGWKVEGLG